MLRQNLYNSVDFGTVDTHVFEHVIAHRMKGVAGFGSAKCHSEERERS